MRLALGSTFEEGDLPGKSFTEFQYPGDEPEANDASSAKEAIIRTIAFLPVCKSAAHQLVKGAVTLRA